MGRSGADAACCHTKEDAGASHGVAELERQTGWAAQGGLRDIWRRRGDESVNAGYVH